MTDDIRDDGIEDPIPEGEDIGDDPVTEEDPAQPTEEDA